MALLILVCFKGPKTPLSNGWVRSVVFGGKQKNNYLFIGRFSYKLRISDYQGVAAVRVGKLVYMDKKMVRKPIIKGFRIHLS